MRKRQLQLTAPLPGANQPSHPSPQLFSRTAYVHTYCSTTVPYCLPYCLPFCSPTVHMLPPQDAESRASKLAESLRSTEAKMGALAAQATRYKAAADEQAAAAASNKVRPGGAVWGSATCLCLCLCLSRGLRGSHLHQFAAIATPSPPPLRLASPRRSSPSTLSLPSSLLPATTALTVGRPREPPPYSRLHPSHAHSTTLPAPPPPPAPPGRPGGSPLCARAAAGGGHGCGRPLPRCRRRRRQPAAGAVHRQGAERRDAGAGAGKGRGWSNAAKQSEITGTSVTRVRGEHRSLCAV